MSMSMYVFLSLGGMRMYMCACACMCVYVYVCGCVYVLYTIQKESNHLTRSRGEHVTHNAQHARTVTGRQKE